MWLKIIAPFLGGVILLAAGIYSAYQFWTPSADDGDVTIWGIGGKFVLGVGAIAARHPADDLVELPAGRPRILLRPHDAQQPASLVAEAREADEAAA